jgi:hypothetical protein
MPDMFSPREVSLQPHPSSPLAEQMRLQVEVQTGSMDEGISALRLDYRVSAADLLVPPPVPPRRCDELWQHTCAEWFVGLAGDPGYREFNFAPSGEWAAYDFSAYRQRTASLPELRPPQILSSVSADGLVVTVLLALDAVMLGEFSRLRWGFTAVLERQNASRSYWALAHPLAQPDFHHRDGFVLTLD